MANVYYNPQQVNNGYSHKDNTWRCQPFNNTILPQYYDRDWSNLNFEGMNTPQRGTCNPKAIDTCAHSLYNNAEYGAYYPITNTIMKSTKKNKSRRRFYKKK